MPQDTQRALHCLAALDRNLIMIEFTPDGVISAANACSHETLGYPEGELLGKPHDMLLVAVDRSQADNQRLWAELRAGAAQGGVFRRATRDGRSLWLQATYMPVTAGDGSLEAILLTATDITAQKLASDGNLAQIAAIGNVMAIAEFDLDGRILGANSLFLASLGYTLDEVIGRHHSLFVAPEQRTSAEYAAFWNALRNGEARTGRYSRIAKDGSVVWIQGSYCPLFDVDGKPFKVVKFARDITTEVEQARHLREAMEQAEQAVQVREALHQSLQEMSTPVIPIWDGILLLPLVGIVDSMRTADVMNKSLNMIAETRAEIFVLDISGVASVDTGVANQLTKITRATQFMGCEAIISGVSPAIARTMVELGVSTTEMRTTATLRNALEYALRKIGVRNHGMDIPREH